MPALLALNTSLLGDALVAIHILPALAGGATLAMVCLIVREFGGGLFATGLAALAFIVSPFWLAMDSFFGYDAFDQLALATLLFLVVRLLRTQDERIWPAIGLTAGFACLLKTTILFLGPGFVVALLLDKRRRDLLTPWPYAGAALFLGVVSPYLAWEIANGFPTLEYWANYHENVLYPYSPLEFLAGIILVMDPLVLPLLLVGAVRLAYPIGGTSYRFLAVTLIVTTALMFYAHAKVFMLVELFIPVVAAAAVGLETLLAQGAWRRPIKLALVPYLVVAGLVAAPASMPILPVDLEKSYAHSFGFLYQSYKLDRLPKAVFPEALADRLGWDGLVAKVADVYNGLDAADRSNCGIYATWYGPAGAIDLFGPRYGLPHATSGQLNYYLWGPGGDDWSCMIVVGQNPRVTGAFASAEIKATYVPEDAAYGMPYNNQVGIYVCHNPLIPIQDLWPMLKYFD